jgi:nucleotide-binding universal stress UspA family protein
MLFNKILVALDGSEYSQKAAGYAFWLADRLDAELAGQHVVDPRLADLFISKEFTEELGLSTTVETSEKVYNAIKRVGKVILQLFKTEAAGRGLEAKTFLDEGHIVEEIIKRSSAYDLLVIGHKGRGAKQGPSESVIGSVAERVVTNSDIPVLVAVQPIDTISQILVAYDGSEPSIGALLMAESLAKSGGQKLTAMMVVPDAAHMPEAKMSVEQGESYLREYWPEDVFMIKQGQPANELIEYAKASKSLLVVGAYGFQNPEDNVLGRTCAKIVRGSQTSLLIYRGSHAAKAKNASLVSAGTKKKTK